MPIKESFTPVQEKAASIIQTIEARFPMDIDLGRQPGLQERSITRAVEKASIISNEQKDALNRLYGKELDMLQIPTTNYETGVTNLFESLYEGLFDGGTIKDRSCSVMFEGEMVPFHEKAVPMLTRSAFITRVLEEHTMQNEIRSRVDGADHHVSIGLIDLHNLRGADFEIEGQPDKPADVLVNKAARAIRDAFRKLGYADQKKLEEQGKLWELGRYGGDEFVIGLFGSFSEEERSAIYKEIQNQLAADKNMSYYQYETVEQTADGEKVVKTIKKEHILLKEINANHDVVEMITFPDDNEPYLAERRVMFKEYLERGLLLTHDEFLKITNKYSRSGVLDFSLYRFDYPEARSNYPEGIATQSQKIAYIQKQHPELAFYFDLAQIYDEMEGANSDNRRHILLETVENSLFDRLIGEAIYSRENFQKYLQEKEFSSVITVDVKFIKEINEKMTYADADMVIKSVWQTIQQSLGPNEREKIMVGRLGSTFVLGVRRGMTLADETVEKIKRITSAPIQPSIQSDLNTYHVPISTTERITPLDDVENEALRDAKFVFRSILQENEEIFYQKLMLDIIVEDMVDPTFIRFIEMRDITSISGILPFCKRDLYTLFLKGKRKNERIPKLQSAYHRLITEQNVDKSLNISQLMYEINQYVEQNEELMELRRLIESEIDMIWITPKRIQAAYDKLALIHV